MSGLGCSHSVTVVCGMYITWGIMSLTGCCGAVVEGWSGVEKVGVERGAVVAIAVLSRGVMGRRKRLMWHVLAVKSDEKRVAERGRGSVDGSTMGRRGCCAVGDG